MSLRGKGSTLGAWKFSKLLGSKFMLVFLVLQPRSDHRLQLHRTSVTVTELIALQQITEGLLFDMEVVAGPDICNNFGHAPVVQCKLKVT